MSVSEHEEVWTHLGMSIALGRPQECHEEVEGEVDSAPCGAVAVALRVDPEEGEPYPVCPEHVRAEMVPLEAVVRFMLDRHAAHAVANRGLARLARVHGDRSET